MGRFRPEASSLITSSSSDESSVSRVQLSMEAMGSLNLELPSSGEIAVGYDKDVTAALQEEISAMREWQRLLDLRRRDALDKLIDLKGSIRVFCRVRPSIATSSYLKTKPQVTVEQEKITVQQQSSVGMIKKEFIFDRVFDQGSTQEDVFVEVKPVVRSALDGHNVCVLAYGQTGTGKTYTMEGGTDGGKQQLGIVPRAIQELFSHASGDDAYYSFSISMLEVYLGSLRDLLAPPRQQQPLFRHTNDGSTPSNNSISILATRSGGVELEGLTDVSIPDLKKANQWYCRGRRARSTSWTNVNDVSSRSHCLTRITIRRRRHGVVTGGGGEGGFIISKLWLVDLGGSERLLKTGASGLTMDEGKAINLSLSALGDVIAALRRKRSHVPYRNSKLTQILGDSLGAGSKVVMVVHISASEDDVSETVCSLSFAERARSIKRPNRDVLLRLVPQDLKKMLMMKQQRISELDKEVSDTEQELKHVNEQIIRKSDILLEEEKKKKKGSPRSTLVVGQIDATESPRAATTEKQATKSRPSSNGSSAPHFMSSTACSRQRRHNSVVPVSHSVSKPRLTKSMTRYHPTTELISGASLKHYYHLPVKSDPINISTSSNSIDSTAASAPKRRESSPRRPPVIQNHQAALPLLHLHRRRMSSLT